MDKLYGIGGCWSHLCPKKWLIFSKLGQRLSQKVGFFLTFWPILPAGFFDKILSLSNKKPLTLFLAFLPVVFSQFSSNII